jgi:transposase
VIGPSGAVRVMVATKPVDFRKGMEGLVTLVRESMGADPFAGAHTSGVADGGAAAK